MFVSLGLLAPARAEDPASFLDLRLAVAPYTRLTNDLPQPLHLSLSLGFLGWGFVAFDVDHGEYGFEGEESGQTYRVLAGLRLRGPDWLDAAGDGRKRRPAPRPARHPPARVPALLPLGYADRHRDSGFQC